MQKQHKLGCCITDYSNLIVIGKNLILLGV